MAKAAHYGFFAKWWDFFLHPMFFYENVLVEGVERSATFLMPLLLLFLCFQSFVYRLPEMTGAAFRFGRFLSLNLFLLSFMVVTFFFLLHGVLRLFRGGGSIGDTFVSYGYGVVFANLTFIVFAVLAVLAGLFIHPVLALILFFVYGVLVVWAAVSIILGLSIAHNIGFIRTVLALIVAGILATCVFFISTDISYFLF